MPMEVSSDCKEFNSTFFDTCNKKENSSMLSLNLINLSIAAVMLVYTSYLDLKKREVEDTVWIAFGIVGGVLQAYEILVGETAPTQLILSIGLAALIGMGLYFFGFYGGADGKALVVLGILVPVFVPTVHLYDIAPLIVLTNGVLISICLPVFILIVNLIRLLQKRPIFEGFSEPAYRKLLACFLGYKQTGKARQFQFIMEKSVSNGNSLTKKFDFSMTHDDFETESGTWVTPGIPLLVFFTIGYFVMLTYGDLVIGLIQFIVHL